MVSIIPNGMAGILISSVLIYALSDASSLYGPAPKSYTLGDSPLHIPHALPGFSKHAAAGFAKSGHGHQDTKHDAVLHKTVKYQHKGYSHKGYGGNDHIDTTAKHPVVGHYKRPVYDYGHAHPVAGLHGHGVHDKHAQRGYEHKGYEHEGYEHTGYKHEDAKHKEHDAHKHAYDDHSTVGYGHGHGLGLAHGHGLGLSHGHKLGAGLGFGSGHKHGLGHAFDHVRGPAYLPKFASFESHEDLVPVHGVPKGFAFDDHLERGFGLGVFKSHAPKPGYKK